MVGYTAPAKIEQLLQMRAGYPWEEEDPALWEALWSGDYLPLIVHAFAADNFDIYRVMDFMSRCNWGLNGLHQPTCIHFCVTHIHTQPGVAERFI